MTKEQLTQLATIGDLQAFAERIIHEITEKIKKDNQREFYSPKEFSEKTGLPYSTVVYYCNMGLMEATQYTTGGAWLIYHSEIEKRIKAAQENKL